MTQDPTPHHVKTEPKFCRCRVCHEHFYGETIKEAQDACLEHARREHSDWGPVTCYCPD